MPELLFHPLVFGTAGAGRHLDMHGHHVEVALPVDLYHIVRREALDSEHLLQFKDDLLRDSPWSQEWEQVERLPFGFEDWELGPTPGAYPLVVLDGLAGRLTPASLHALLRNMRMITPDARLIAALPGYGSQDVVRWSNGTLRRLGWDPEEDILLGPRHRLASIAGDGVCPGMYPQRVLRLRAGLIPIRRG